MKVTIEIPDYSPNTGIPVQWVGVWTVSTSGTMDSFILSANKAGLLSLAIQLLTLAQDNVPTGCHIHYDQHNSLEDDSIDLVIQKTD